MEQIYHHFNIKTTDKKAVFNAINTADGIKQWWTVGAEKHENEFTFTFNGNFFKKFNVIEEKIGEHVIWECIDAAPEWIGTKVEFTILLKEDSIDLSFKHSNWKSQTSFFATCNYHWGLYLRSLKKYLETGTGEPHKF